MSLAWRQTPERGSHAALALIHWIGLRIGRPAGRALLYPITLYFLLTAAAPRRAARQYLRRALDHPPRPWHLFAHFHCFAATILDRVFLLAGQIERFDVGVHGGALVLDRAALGQGCLLLGAHLGSFEMLRVIGVSGPKLRLKVLMNVDHNQTMTRFVHALNPELARTIVPIGGPGTLIEVQERLAEGFFIGALGDRVVACDRTVACRFFGGEARFPLGPFALAAVLGCPVILALGLYRGGRRYDVVFEQLADVVPAEHRRRPEALQPLVQRYAERLEHYARQAPYNWFNFYDFWDEDHRAR